MAPSARMPRSCSAESTVVAVVQYSLVAPSTVTVSLRPYRTEMWSPSLTEEASEGTTTSCGPTAMSCLSRTSATVEPRTWTERRLPVDGDLRRPCRSGRRRPNRRPRRARRRPERHDEEVERTAQVLQRSCVSGHRRRTSATGRPGTPRSGRPAGVSRTADDSGGRGGPTCRPRRSGPGHSLHRAGLRGRRSNFGNGESSGWRVPLDTSRHTSPTRYETCVTVGRTLASARSPGAVEPLRVLAQRLAQGRHGHAEHRRHGPHRERHQRGAVRRPAPRVRASGRARRSRRAAARAGSPRGRRAGPWRS